MLILPYDYIRCYYVAIAIYHSIQGAILLLLPHITLYKVLLPYITLYKVLLCCYCHISLYIRCYCVSLLPYTTLYKVLLCISIVIRVEI